MDEAKKTEVAVQEDVYEVSPITLDDVKKIADENYKTYSVLNWRGHDLVVRKIISYDEMSAFVNAVVSSCFNTETGEYEPQNRDFMYKYGEILFYTNVQLPSETAEAYDLVYAMDLNDFVERHINPHQLADIQSSIAEAIDYRLEQNVDVLKAEMKKFEDIFVQLGETMSKLDPDDMKKTMDAIMEHGAIDEKKIVQALFPQKADDANSDG